MVQFLIKILHLLLHKQRRCIFFACVAISVRSLSKTEPNYRIAFYFTVLCSILGLITIFQGDWVLPSKIDLAIFIVMGLCGSVANLLLTQSYRLAEASLVTPIKYLSLVFAKTKLKYFIGVTKDASANL